MDTSWLGLVLLVGFAARLIRLAVADSITDPIRNWLIIESHRRWGRAGIIWTERLVECPFCIGYWISGAVLASWALWSDTGWWRFVAGWFTLSYVAGHLVARLDLDTED